MNITNEIKLYNILKDSIGAVAAEAFLQLMETKTEARLNEKTNVFATKEDIAELKVEIAHSKVDVIKWMIATTIAACAVIIAAVRM